MIMNFSEGLVDQFEFAILLTTLTALVPYLFVAAAYILITIDKKVFINNKVKILILGLLGFAYSLWAIYGSGSETVFSGGANTDQMKRSPQELADWLMREVAFPHGVFLMTGTCLVPGDDFTLRPNDQLTVRVGELTLKNQVAG